MTTMNDELLQDIERRIYDQVRKSRVRPFNQVVHDYVEFKVKDADEIRKFLEKTMPPVHAGVTVTGRAQVMAPDTQSWPGDTK